jgi:DNA polymerase III subunit epsilon
MDLFCRIRLNEYRVKNGHTGEKCQLIPLSLLTILAKIMYVIVDIETTGGYASANGITEIAIMIHDGTRVVETYETLINPIIRIPRYIQALTGITDEMVADAPVFDDVARTIFDLLQGNIFVAHNVNFDYSFVKHHLAAAGYTLDCKKLCTVRLTRKFFPGLHSYSLGNLCRHFNIPVENRHRAGGDAAATVHLFELLLKAGAETQIQQSLKKKSREQALPPNLPREQAEQLPDSPGVYYFHNNQRKIIYVGKAKSLKKRVYSHFSNNSAGRQKQDFMREIHRITYELCGSELMAFILESVEIKRLWPPYNRALKRFEPAYGIYMFEDRKGYLRLAIEKRKQQMQPLYTFHLLREGQVLLRKMVEEFGLCAKMCFLQKTNIPCTGIDNQPCSGACTQTETPVIYNERVREAIHHLELNLPSFLIKETGRQEGEQALILMEKGNFYGMGYFPADTTVSGIEALKTQLSPYPSNDFVKGLLLQYAAQHPENCTTL